MRINQTTRLLLLVGLIQMQLTTCGLAQFRKLHDFMYEIDGAYPLGGLTHKGTTIYGTTWMGGAHGIIDESGFYRGGTVWSLDTLTGHVNTLYHFDVDAEGANPRTGMVLDGDTLYGTAGNNPNFQTPVWSLDTVTGTFDVLRVFDRTDQGFWEGNLARSGDVLYGTTYLNELKSFNVVTESAEVLRTFSSPDGFDPFGVTLDGTTLYGVTRYGGSGRFNNRGLRDGTIWSYDTVANSFTKLYDFGSTAVDGFEPIGNIVVAGRVIYGTLAQGGRYDAGTLWSYDMDADEFSVLHHFDGGRDRVGKHPADIVLHGNKIYGVAVGDYLYADPDDGTLWSFDLDKGEFFELYLFERNVTGGRPTHLLLMGNTLFGTAENGGANAYFSDVRAGTIWSYQIIPEPCTFQLFALCSVLVAARRPRGSTICRSGLAADAKCACRMFFRG